MSVGRKMQDLSTLGLERPLFGQIARQLVGLRLEHLEPALKRQQETGGRLGEILVSEGLLTRGQVADVLRFQARWMAQAMKSELRNEPSPYPAFLSLCLPAYNERENIEDSLDAACAILPEFVQNFEVVVVDDGSTDGTGEVVARYAEGERRVRLVQHEQNRGYGAAVTSGLRAARGDLVVFTDADGQFSILDLPQLLARLEGCELVIGYRYRRADHWVRRLNARGWTLLIGVLFGIRVRDLDCAFKLFRREVIDGLNLTATGAAINAEIMVQCIRQGLRFRETPVTHYLRYHGAPTGAALRVIWRAFRELPQLWKYHDASPPVLLSTRAGAIAPTRTVEPTAP